MPDVSTIVFSGGAYERAPAIARGFRGGTLLISSVVIDDHVSYAQHSMAHLLHMPLVGHMRGRRRDLRFTPGDHERRGWTGPADILGLQLGFDDWFMEEACEQRFVAGSSAVRDGDHARLAILADAAAALSVASTTDPIVRDTVLLALARNLGRVYGNAAKRRDDGWLHPRALSRVIDRLRAQPGGPATVHELATEAGLGVSAFIRAFRGSVGLTPAAFAQRLRLDDAAHMLKQTDLPIAEIAALCGFSSASHFVFAFRASRGVTPARWRTTMVGSSGSAIE